MEDFQKKHAPKKTNEEGRGKWGNKRGRGGWRGRGGRGGRGGKRGGYQKKQGDGDGPRKYYAYLNWSNTYNLFFKGTYNCKYHGECRHKWSECSKNPANGGDYYGDKPSGGDSPGGASDKQTGGGGRGGSQGGRGRTR